MKHFFTLFVGLVFSLNLGAQAEKTDLRISVYFASASHTLEAAELGKLAKFSTDLGSYADYTLKIEAFTDEQGTANYNDALANRRAATVAQALANHQVVAASSEVLAYGEQRARTNTTDDAERRKDRRVDLLATVTRWPNAFTALEVTRAAQKQTFAIEDPSLRQTITGRSGGVFLLEPNSLVRADGSPARGPVVVQLVEAYDLSDMILAGLTTTAAGKRLVTGGMIRLTASDADGERLDLRANAALTASIPTDDFNESMRIFSGAGHNEAGAPVDWDLTGGGVAASPEALFAVAPQLPNIEALAVDARKLVGPRLAQWRRANPKPKAPSYVDPNRIATKAPKAVQLDKVTYQPKGLKRLFMSKAKKEEETEAKRQKVQRTYERRMSRYEDRLAYRQRLPEINEEKRLDYEQRLAAWETAFNLAKDGLMEEASQALYAAAEKRIKAMQEARAARLAALGEELAGLDDLAGNEINVRRYFFSVTQLGWTNVDIYAGAEDRLEVLAALPNGTPEATVIMVPADRPSILAYVPGAEGAWKRSGIAAGVGYHVLAYQVQNGQLMLAHRYVASADETTISLAYAPVAIGDLKEKLAKILGS